MARGRFVPNSKGFRDVLTSADTQAQLDGLAQAAAATANAAMGGPGPTDQYGYRATSRSSPSKRAAAYVRTGGWKSRRDNAKNNTLIKSVAGQARKAG